MGMTLKGAKRGDFHAQIWAWRPIHVLCNHVNRLFDLGLTIDGWEYNGTDGLKTQDECDRLAMGLQKFIEDHWQNGSQVITLEYAAGPDAGYVWMFPRQEVGVNAPVERSIKLSHLLKLVGFLRKCGGFEIL